MKPLYHPNAAQITLAGVLYALGDPARLKIVAAKQGEQPCLKIWDGPLRCANAPYAIIC